jgi:hypothetical protein
MYKKTTAAGVIFLIGYIALTLIGIGLVFVGILMYASLTTGADDSLFDKMGVNLSTLVATVIFIISAVCIFGGIVLSVLSGKMIKAGKKSATQYKAERKTIIVFTVIQAILAAGATAFVAAGKAGLLKSGNQVVPVPDSYFAIPVFLILGVILLVADLIKNSKEIGLLTPKKKK